MAQRIVAELGRPETPDETAARKAESSRVYRSSQTARNLVAALIVTVAVVAVIFFAVPRGTLAEADPIDVTAVAAQVADTEGQPIVAPDMGEGWVANLAQLDDVGGLRAFAVVWAQDDDQGTSFVRVAQGFEADAGWPARVLTGAAVGETVVIDGIDWIRYEISDAQRAGNISAALSTQAGADTVIVYGSDDASLETAAASIADDVSALREETP
ncbi:DUF4245 domain-containing protein [Microbacterium fluvii]|uniref:DUF4245 domain-containing protein n=1 Tax=Microbacterium fluvii TaxID=415215 RepID=A0ABW2HDU9_9MICO|nr:DUF4245 domain-containing protein [Microbacterium fluvii]MCU4672319.1 DUF4245 domain-containing protein [Microbacterium fluvii]